MAFPRSQISKFSGGGGGGACPQTPLVVSDKGAYENFILVHTSSKSHAMPCYSFIQEGERHGHNLHTYLMKFQSARSTYAVHGLLNKGSKVEFFPFFFGGGYARSPPPFFWGGGGGRGWGGFDSVGLSEYSSLDCFPNSFSLAMAIYSEYRVCLVRLMPPFISYP